jgi:hypothetical protein
MNVKLYSVVLECSYINVEEPYEDLAFSYVIADGFDDAAEKATRNYINKNIDKKDKPLLTEDGSLNPFYTADTEDYKIVVKEIEFLTDNIIS